MFEFKGSKGSGGSSAAVRTPDTLRSKDEVEVILALGEGPIKGLHDGDKSFFVGDTPLKNASDEYNFTLFQTQFFPGDEIADPVIPRLGGFANSTSVNLTLAANTPVVRQTQSGDIDYIDVRLVIPQLYFQTDTGVFTDELSFRVEYKPSDSSTWSKFFGDDITINGKTTTSYVKQLRQAVARLTIPYDIRVTKLSADSDTQHFRVISWESFQEIFHDEKKTYPNTAIVQVSGQATDQFSSIPQFSGIYDGMVIKVPSNYNPTTRAYTGLWDGTFKLDFSNNNAWVLYDFVTNDRYGVNAYFPVALDKYDVYDAAVWCDTPVDDGLGGTQPRYTFNGVISEAQNGKELAAYIAGSFNAALIDNLDGTCSLKVDKDEQAVAMFTAENIDESGFSYSYSDINTRYNDITVTFLNPDLDWAEDRRRVFDQASIDALGRIPLDFVAVGCTNAAEAIRRAQYKLVTSLTEKEAVVFKTNRLGQFVAPWEVILIADPNMGYAVSGRIKSINTGRTVLTLRDAVYLEAGPQYKIKIQYAGQIVEREVLTISSGSTTSLTLTAALPTGVPDNAVFSLEDAADGLNGLPKPYRVLKVSETDGSPDLFEINAIEINRAKFDTADTLDALSPPGYSKNPTQNIGPPTGMVFTNVSYVASDGTYRPRLRVDWTSPEGISVQNYQVQYKLHTDLDYDGMLLTEGSNTYIALTILEDRSDYDVRVRAVNAFGFQSEWLVGESSGDIPNDAPPGQCTGLAATGGVQQIALKWTNPSDLDLKHVEIHANTVDDVSTSTLVGTVAGTSFINAGLPNTTTRYYWVRAVDRSGNLGEYNSNLGTAATTILLTGSDIITDFIDGSALLADLRDGVLSDPDYIKSQDAIKQLLTLIDDRYAAYKLTKGENARAFATVTSQISTVQTDSEAVAQSVTDLTASIGDSLATINTTLTALSTSESATASAVTTLTSDFNTNVAAVQSTLSTLATADSAEATARLALATTVAGNTASISAESSARSSTDSALASSITSLTTTVGGNTSAISTQATSINGLQAQYSVKIDINGRVTGFGLSSTAVGATPTSDFIVIADNFSLVHPGATSNDPIVPFLITTVDGEDVLVFKGEIKADSIDTVQLKIGGVITDRIAENAVTGVAVANNDGPVTLTDYPSFQSMVTVEDVTIADTSQAVLLTFTGIGQLSHGAGHIGVAVVAQKHGGGDTTLGYFSRCLARSDSGATELFTTVSVSLAFIPSSSGTYDFDFQAEGTAAGSGATLELMTASATVFKR